MNRAKLTELKGWLDAGAPHVVFHMSYGGSTLNEVPDYLREEAHAKGIGECGTVCCIAGYVCQMTHGQKWLLNTGDFDDIAEQACLILGLPYDPEASFGHDLFAPDRAPEGCTPQQAAQAVQNVIEGREPWT